MTKLYLKISKLLHSHAKFKPETTELNSNRLEISSSGALGYMYDDYVVYLFTVLITFLWLLY